LDSKRIRFAGQNSLWWTNICVASNYLSRGFRLVRPEFFEREVFARFGAAFRVLLPRIFIRSFVAGFFAVLTLVLLDRRPEDFVAGFFRDFAGGFLAGAGRNVPLFLDLAFFDLTAFRDTSST
jgi:hypothetical protein